MSTATGYPDIGYPDLGYPNSPPRPDPMIGLMGTTIPTMTHEARQAKRRAEVSISESQRKAEILAILLNDEKAQKKKLLDDLEQRVETNKVLESRVKLLRSCLKDLKSKPRKFDSEEAERYKALQEQYKQLIMETRKLRVENGDLKESLSNRAANPGKGNGNSLSNVVKIRKTHAQCRKEAEELREKIDRLTEEFTLQIDTLAAELQNEKEKNEDLQKNGHGPLQKRVRFDISLSDQSGEPSAPQSSSSEISATEALSDYEDVLRGVKNWVEQWLSPIFRDEQLSASILSAVTRDTSALEYLQELVSSHADLCRLATFPDLVEELMCALIMRHLQRELFSIPVYLEVAKEAAMMEQLTNSMETAAKSTRRDEFSVRTWRADFYNNLVRHPDFGGYTRPSVRERLTKDLANLFRWVPAIELQRNQFRRSLEAKILIPAMRFHERINGSISRHVLDFNHVVRSVGYNADEEGDRAVALREGARDVQCKDILGDARRTVDLVGEIKDNATLKLFYQVCNLSPALLRTEIVPGKGAKQRQTVTVAKQAILVALGTGVQRQAKIAKMRPSLIQELLLL